MSRPFPLPRPRHLVILGMLAAAAAAPAACSRDTAVSHQSADQSVPGPPGSHPAEERAAGFGAAESKRILADAAAVAPAPASVPQQLPRGTDSLTTSMIIRNGYVSIQVDSLEVAVASIRSMAARLGGYIGNVSTNTGEFQVRSSTIEVKVPSARFDEAMSTLTPLGKVEQSNATAEDVGEEFVDTRARMENARRLEERLVNLLGTRTGKLEDVLAVERELARVREEIERYEGRLRFLRARTAMSTLSITVHEAAPLVNPNPGTNVLAEAVKAMWRNFVSLVAAAIASLGILVPVGVIAGVVVWIVRKWHRPPASAA